MTLVQLHALFGYALAADALLIFISSAHLVNHLAREEPETWGVWLHRQGMRYHTADNIQMFIGYLSYVIRGSDGRTGLFVWCIRGFALLGAVLIAARELMPA